jgi:hypothetical protein
VKDEKYPKGATTERGKRLYDERVRPNVDEEAQRGTFVAIDVETGDWVNWLRRTGRRRPSGGTTPGGARTAFLHARRAGLHREDRRPSACLCSRG